MYTACNWILKVVHYLFSFWIYRRRLIAMSFTYPDMPCSDHVYFNGIWYRIHEVILVEDGKQWVPVLYGPAVKAWSRKFLVQRMRPEEVLLMEVYEQ